MSAVPVALYQIFFSDGKPFNVHAASCSLLSDMIRSRFIGREHGLMVRECEFEDLACRQTTSKLRKTREELIGFTSSRPANLVVVINTHADPMDGGLLYGHNKTTSLDSVCDHMFGHRFPFHHFKKSVLFVVCCGGLAKHGLTEIQRASTKFDVVFAFGASMLDPILAISQFATSIVDFYIIGQEDLWRAIPLSLKQEIMKHTSIYVGSNGQVQRACDASWRRRPNGEDVRCCRQVAKYMGTDRSGRIKFRCCVPTHHGSRTFFVTPFPSVSGVRRFLGRRGGPRYMVSLCQ
ncbi:hypothetical protein L227DRAFT_493643 [Lentinus tigrinus ALCF2SS1-6]|uniref:Uncharacterized protein n=1 Tax=Lentinus tigrinus ALCF2SS1-6 TaxID=1328759 RepID=A0A5C2SPJ3_9APHY|nr:hypothetical protein L227DRAFT_493643 [Lentinus tigrinus ALCF2SS1-6]